jgi:hypothetical protein
MKRILGVKAMDTYPESNVVEPNPASTATTVVFLATFAIIVSWLVCFALPNVLVSADLMSPWPVNSDPRPQWMIRVFTSVFGGFAFLALVFRWLSQRQLRRIDAMSE